MLFFETQCTIVEHCVFCLVSSFPSVLSYYLSIQRNRSWII